MNENRTVSMLQRVPVILAVTASSYGLDPQAGARKPRAGAARRREAPQAHAGHGKPMAQR